MITIKTKTKQKKIRTPQNCYNYPKILVMWFYHRVMCPKGAGGMANSVDPDLTSLDSVQICICTVCPKIFG